MATPAGTASGTTRYTTVAIILHWMIALGILTLIAMGLVMPGVLRTPAWR